MRYSDKSDFASMVKGLQSSANIYFHPADDSMVKQVVPDVTCSTSTI
jgi:hypothetical protein